MIFIVKNLRNGLVERLESCAFKRKIITETRGIYERSSVLPERTGLRPESIDGIISRLEDYSIIKDIYLVTTLSRINNDQITRYMILIDGNIDNHDISSLFHNYIPVYSISIKNVVWIEGQATPLSHWFRNTMGGGFSFSNIDYLVTNAEFSKTVLIEEKIGKSGLRSLGYGQLRSYKELLQDVIKVPNCLLCVFSTRVTNLHANIQYCILQKDNFARSNILETSTQTIQLNYLSDIIKELMES